MRTVISVYPWKNPLQKIRSNCKTLHRSQNINPIWRNTCPIKKSYCLLQTAHNANMYFVKWKKGVLSTYSFMTASKSWVIIAKALKIIPKTYNQKFWTFIFLEGRFLIIACKVKTKLCTLYLSLLYKTMHIVSESSLL